jgi:hypothetical protein
MILALLACNTAPVWWSDYGVAPGGSAGWGHPSDTRCRAVGGDDAYEIDGFLLCRTDKGPVPIDDPIHTRCDAAELAPGETVFYAFDGVRAKVWPLSLVEEREIFHDTWDGTEIVGVF